MSHLLIDFTAPRHDPLAHPGRRPPDSYLFDGKENVFLLDKIEKGIEHIAFVTSEGMLNVNQFLKEQGVATLEQRIPVLAYGTNPCPGQLAFKFRSFETRIVPVIKGTLNGWDTIYKFLCSPGYAYAQLIPAKDVEAEAWVTLLDQQQFEHMNRTEGTFSLPKHYEVGMLENFKPDNGEMFSALFYVGNTKVFLSPRCDGYENTAISIAEIPAKGRITPSLTQEEILNHCIRVFELEDFLLECFEQEERHSSASLGRRLAGFLNRHFLAHGGEGNTCNRCQGVLTHVHDLAEHQYCHSLSIAESPEVQSTLLTDPNKSPLTFGDVWG